MRVPGITSGATKKVEEEGRKKEALEGSLYFCGSFPRSEMKISLQRFCNVRLVYFLNSSKNEGIVLQAAKMVFIPLLDISKLGLALTFIFPREVLLKTTLTFVQKCIIQSVD